MKKGKIFIISAPSGTGKTTLVSKLISEMPNQLCRSVSCTTRPPRVGEKDGIDYYFLDDKQFHKQYESGEFLETAHIYGYMYGTLRRTVEDLQNQGKDVLLVIDVQGSEKLRDVIEAVYIFICPPSTEELEKRIRGRKKDSSEMIDKRLARARDEMKKRFDYDHVITNDKVEVAVEELKQIIKEQQ